VKTNPKHEAAYQDLVAIVRKYEGELSPSELLAIAANLTGKLVALQDQRTMTPELAMEIVSRNLELGNQQALAELLGPSKGHS
jgi:hypothetical protein